MIAEELVVKKRFIFLTRGYWLEDEHTNSVIMQLLDTVMGQRFVENGNRTIKDLQTGLVWQESYAYIETGNNISWYDAQEYIGKLNHEKLGGYDDWRLPSRLEIQSIYEIAKPFQSRGKTFILHIDPVFEFSYGSCFWTSKTRWSAALGFEFDMGDIHWYPKGSHKGTVRAVRDNWQPLLMIDPGWAEKTRDL
ncbi:MAG: DUF1566 domain-containing protein [Nitrospinae bacterium]|nr:DUF1566 domain-containing protein [Nitrospinota bacterium]MZH45803.1 DUF1566 domain-containing protein [Nitrospinota bacterium]